MKKHLKNFAHGVSLGVFKKKLNRFGKQAEATADTLSDSVAERIDNGLEYVDDSLEEMRHDLDALKREDRFGMWLAKIIMFCAIMLIVALEFLFQIGGINIFAARVSQILWATLGAGAAMASMPAARQLMRPGKMFPRVAAGIVLAIVIMISFYVLFNASSQINSGRLGRQDVGASQAVSNAKRLKAMLAQQETLVAKDLPLADEDMLEAKVADALKAGKGKRRLGYATSNCNARYIARRYRSACRIVKKDRAVLSDIRNLKMLNKEIPLLEQKIASSNTATNGDASGEVLSGMVGVSQKMVQLYSQLYMVIGVCAVIYLYELIIYYNYWQKVGAQKQLEKGIRQGEREAKRAGVAAHKAANPEPERITKFIEKKPPPFSIAPGSDHELVMQFFHKGNFDQEEKLPELNKRYTLWREEQGKTGLLLIDFRKVVKKLVDEKQLAGVEMGQNEANIFVLYGLETFNGVAA